MQNNIILDENPVLKDNYTNDSIAISKGINIKVKVSIE